MSLLSKSIPKRNWGRLGWINHTDILFDKDFSNKGWIKCYGVDWMG